MSIVLKKCINTEGLSSLVDVNTGLNVYIYIYKGSLCHKRTKDFENFIRISINPWNVYTAPRLKSILPSKVLKTSFLSV